MRSVVLVRRHVYQGLETFLLPFLPLPRNFAGLRSVEAEPSRQKHLCQQHESSLWHSSHEPEAHVLLENFDLLMHTLEIRTHQRLPDCHQTVQKFWVICWSTHCVHPSRHHSHQCTSQHHPHSILRHHTH